MSDIFEKIRNCYISKNRACLYLQQVVREIYDNVTQILGDTRLIDNARKKVVDEIAETLDFRMHANMWKSTVCSWLVRWKVSLEQFYASGYESNGIYSGKL